MTQQNLIYPSCDSSQSSTHLVKKDNNNFCCGVKGMWEMTIWSPTWQWFCSSGSTPLMTMITNANTVILGILFGLPEHWTLNVPLSLIKKKNKNFGYTADLRPPHLNIIEIQWSKRSKDGTVGYCVALVQEVLSSIPGSHILVSTSFRSV